MIEEPSILILGRTETGDETLLARVFVERHLAKACGLVEFRYGLEAQGLIQQIREADAFALYGPYGAWTTIDFLRWKGFGSSYFPELCSQIRYVLATDQIDPQKMPYEPPILLRTHELLPAGQRQTPEIPIPIRRFRDHYELLEREGFARHPEAVTKRGLVRLLAERGLRVRKDGIVPGPTMFDRVHEVAIRSEIDTPRRENPSATALQLLAGIGSAHGR